MLPGWLLSDVREQVSGAAGDDRAGEMTARLLTNIATTTIDLGEDGEETWVITGDIPAMWLRDSCLQLSPLLRLAPRHPELAEVAAGLLRRHWRMILVDPYANAFNRRPNGNRWDDDRPRQGPWVWERRWELDSLTFPLDLALRLDGLGCREWLNVDFHDALDVILTIRDRTTARGGEPISLHPPLVLLGERDVLRAGAGDRVPPRSRFRGTGQPATVKVLFASNPVACDHAACCSMVSERCCWSFWPAAS